MAGIRWGNGRDGGADDALPLTSCGRAPSTGGHTLVPKASDLFVNGAMQKTGLKTHAERMKLDVARLGGGERGHYSGFVSELRVWNTPQGERSEAKIAKQMFWILNGAEIDLVGYWRLNEGGGENSENKEAKDLSPSALHRVISEGVTWTANAPTVATLPAGTVPIVRVLPSLPAR